MALDFNSDLLNPMIAAGRGLGGSIWHQMEVFALPELKKIAVQIEGIATDMLQNPPPYTQKAALDLMDMQIRASIGVIVGMTTLVLQDVQVAIAAIVGAIGKTVNAFVGFALIA